MANILAGRRQKWFLLAGWVVLLAVALPFAAQIGSVTKNEATSTMPRGAQSTQVALQAKEFTSNKTVQTLIVYTRIGGLTTSDQTKIEQDRLALNSFSATGPINTALQSQDASASLLTVRLLDHGENVPNQTKDIRAYIA